MRLLIELGYQKLLLAESANAVAVLEALMGATQVEEKSQGYPHPSKYAPKLDASSLPAPLFISDAQLIDEDAAAEMDIETLKKRNEELQTKSRAATKELAALKAKVDGLTEQAED